MNNTTNQSQTPKNLLPHHFEEWQLSGVNPEITAKNVISISSQSIYEYLCYSDEIKRLNTGRLPSSILRSYRTLEDGGWWVSGVDLLTHENSLWGQFKPDNPRIVPSKSLESPDESGKSPDKKTKPIKYEAPRKTPTELIALRVPMEICQKIAHRYNLTFDESPDNFWKWVLAHPQIPVAITEGAKKAGAMLTQGIAAIALPGIYSGYRSPKDKFGKPWAPPHLIPQLEVFATKNRKIYFAFDNDKKESTRINVRKATRTTADLFENFGCKTYILSWTGKDKGIDDFIVNQGSEAFEKAYRGALALPKWQINQAVSLTYKPNVEVDSRFLPKLDPPENANVILLKAPKGTGKTQWTKRQVLKYLNGDRPVLVLSHRVQLCEMLCNECGVDYQTHRFTSETRGVFGIGLCVDSMHKRSGARFNPEDWYGAVIIIDEVEQVLWHMLNSSTCKADRVPILRNMKKVIQNSLMYGGKIFMADADLSDISIKWLNKTAGDCEIKQWLMVNNYQPENPWDIYHYEHSRPNGLVKKLEDHVESGGRPFVCVSGQRAKSKYSTQGLEEHFHNKFPHLKILRIDAETLGDPNHPAYGCMSNLNEILNHYDMVIVSPAIETGVSIECTTFDGKTPHFTSVWCIAQGVQTANSVCQALARVRAAVPRHIWINRCGLQKVGNGGVTIHRLLSGSKNMRDAHINLLLQGGLSSADSVDLDFEAESLIAWAQRAVTINIARFAYRETIISALKEEGHNIHDSREVIEGSEQVNEELEACKNKLYKAEREKIVEAGNPTDDEYKKLKDKRSKTENERLRYRHGNLFRTYKVKVTDRLIELDDKGFYSDLNLHYYLTKGREFIKNHDVNNAVNQFMRGEGSIFTPDFNRSQIGLKIWMLDQINIKEILENKQRREDSDFIVEAAEFIFKYHKQYKDVFGIKAFNRDGTRKTNMTLILSVLSLLGLKCARIRKVTVDGKQVQVYSQPVPDFEKIGNKAVVDEWDCPIPIMDMREKIFDAWHERDMLKMNDKSNPYLKLVTDGNNKKEDITVNSSPPKLEELSQEVRQTIEDVKSAIEIGGEGLAPIWQAVEKGIRGLVRSCLTALEQQKLEIVDPMNC